MVIGKEAVGQQGAQTGAGRHVHATALMWSSEDNLRSWFHHVGFSDGTQVVSFGGKCPYPLNHLAGPKMPLLIFPLGFSVLLSHHGIVTV